MAHNSCNDASQVLYDDTPNFTWYIQSKLNRQQSLTEPEFDFIALHPEKFLCDGCGELKNPLQDVGDFQVCGDCVNWAVLSVGPTNYCETKGVAQDATTD